MKQLLPWREMKARVQPRAVIDVSALLAILVVIVVLFMVLPTLYWCDLCPIPTVDLPRANNARPVRDLYRNDPALTIYVTRDGFVYFGPHRVEPENLPPKISEALRGGAEPRVYINADRHARYGSVAEVVDQVRSAGITDIVFVTEGRFSGLEPGHRNPGNSTPPPHPAPK